MQAKRPREVETEGSGTYDGLFSRPPSRWDYTPLEPGERAIVLGMGGGCDVFAAVAFAEAWSLRYPEAVVMFGTFKGALSSLDGLKQLAPHLHQPVEVRVHKPEDGEGYGTALLERSCPTGAEGSPMIIEVPSSGGDGADVAEVTSTNSAAICAALKALRVSRILAVDCGGDSLTGGIDFDSHVELGRDRQVLRALQASGIPFVQLLIGPGSDGESSIDDMRAAMRPVEASGGLLGVLPLDSTGLIAAMATHSRTLGPSRTPNIMQSAMSSAPAEDAAVESDLFAVTRHGRTVPIPRSWLLLAVALEMDLPVPLATADE